MQINLGGFKVSFENGGLRVIRDGKTLYFNARPVYVSVKTYAAINEFRDIAYENVYENGDGITGEAVFVTKNGKPLDRSNIWSDTKSFTTEGNGGLTMTLTFSEVTEESIVFSFRGTANNNVYGI